MCLPSSQMKWLGHLNQDHNLEEIKGLTHTRELPILALKS